MITQKSILGVRIDSIEQPLDEVLGSIKNEKNSLIVALDMYDILSINRNKKLKEIVKNAALVIPASPTVVRAYNFLHRESIHYQKDFLFFSNILSYAENNSMSTFIYGDDEKYFFTLTEKIKKLYPYIKIVGTYKNLKDSNEIRSALVGFRKIDPAIFIIWLELKKTLLWFDEYKDDLELKLLVSIKRPLDAFVGKEKSPDLSVIIENKEGGFYLKRNIFRIFNFIPHICFWVLVFFEKIFFTKKRK